MTLIAMTLTLAKPVAVMVHGAGGGGWEYKFWKPVFEKAGYRVVAKDLVPAPGGLIKTHFEDYVDQVVRMAGDRPDVLIGASMGGVLVLKAAERVHPKAIVLVCSATPAGFYHDLKVQPYPEIVKWKGGPYKDTVDSMPDSDEATRKFAHVRWRDESGRVLNQIRNGIVVQTPTCRALSVIPERDDTVPPEFQQSLAARYRADTLCYPGMSHVGPLLSKTAPTVAAAVVSWLAKG